MFAPAPAAYACSKTSLRCGGATLPLTEKGPRAFFGDDLTACLDEAGVVNRTPARHHHTTTDRVERVACKRGAGGAQPCNAERDRKIALERARDRLLQRVVRAKVQTAVDDDSCQVRPETTCVRISDIC
jgi:hypothetical protein